MPRATYKKRKDGRIRVKYKDKYFYGETQSEALAKKDAYIRQLEKGINMSKAGVTVCEYAADWLPVYKANVSAKTYNDYASQLNKLVKVLGDKLVAEVTPSMAKRVYNEYLGMSDSTIKRSRMLFISLFESAIADGIRHTNPFKEKTAKPHKGSVGSHRIITDEERQLILSTPHRMQTAAMCMLYAGLRRGEVMALDVSKDVDFSSDELTVSRTVRFEGNQPIIEKHAKTAAGLRTIPVFAQLRPFLRSCTGLVAHKAGSLDTMTQIAFKRAWESYMLALSKSAGRKISIRPHDLRHSYCTMLRDAGVEMKLAIQWMGHADEKMILKIYDHVTEQRVYSAVNAVEKMLSGGQNGGQN